MPLGIGPDFLNDNLVSKSGILGRSIFSPRNVDFSQKVYDPLCFTDAFRPVESERMHDGGLISLPFVANAWINHIGP
jgi:hypothetical protein